jgi:hypothetical protein
VFATTLGGTRSDSACGWTHEQVQFYSSNTIPGKQELTIPEYEQPTNFMVSKVTHVPQPKFDSVPMPMTSLGYRLGGLPARSMIDQAPPADAAYNLPDRGYRGQQESYAMDSRDLQRRSIAGSLYGPIMDSLGQAPSQWPVVQYGAQYSSSQYEEYKPVVYQQPQFLQYHAQQLQQQQQQQQQHFAQSGMYDVALPQYEDQPIQYPEAIPYVNPPAATTSGGNERGFTGHGSGVGE